MAYPNEGTLVTDEREIAISETWDSQTDWEAYQSLTDVVISNGVVMLEESVIPDSGILHEWPTDAGSGSTISDAKGSADISLNGDPQWDDTTVSWWNDWAILYDGTDDYGVVSSNRTDPGDSGSFVLTVRFPSIGTNEFAFAHPDTTNGNRLYCFIDDSGNLAVNVGDTSIILDSSPQTDTTYRCGVSWDAGSSTGYLNGVEQGTATYTGSVSLTTTNWYFGNQNGTDLPANVFVDFPRITDDVWTAQQFGDDYNGQPWS